MKVFGIFILLIIANNVLEVGYNKEILKMAKIGLLMLSNLSKISSILPNASKYVSQILYITITDSSLPILSYSDSITKIYKQATQVCDDLDVRVLVSNLKNPGVKTNIKTNFPIDIVMFDNHQIIDGEPRDFVKSYISKLKNDFDILKIDSDNQINDKINVGNNVSNDKIYKHTALGGTFDRIHNGHKILLSQGILRTTKSLTIGVTDISMIKSKKLWELIEPTNIRIQNLKLLLNDIDSTLEYNVVKLEDIYGPTKDDPNLELLVVSEETAKNGNAVNKKRFENKLNPLDIYCIDLANENEVQHLEEEQKISSSNRRMRLLGTVLKNPIERKNLKPYPYIIGLTGGIASGKTNIAERLRKLGAGVVNCDLLAHEIYKPGTPMNATIANVFGQDIMSESGEVDRKKLGNIVFNDPSRLIELNDLLWPAILELTKKRIVELGNDGYKIVVMEAAVLIQAGWQNHCHQVWTSIIPPNEAIKRLIERNGLTEESAKVRLASQPSNSEQVAVANVVFSSFWSYEFTTKQVVKAWEDLLKYLYDKSKL